MARQRPPVELTPLSVKQLHPAGAASPPRAGWREGESRSGGGADRARHTAGVEGGHPRPAGRFWLRPPFREAGLPPGWPLRQAGAAGQPAPCQSNAATRPTLRERAARRAVASRPPPRASPSSPPARGAAGLSAPPNSGAAPRDGGRFRRVTRRRRRPSDERTPRPRARQHSVAVV